MVVVFTERGDEGETVFAGSLGIGSFKLDHIKCVVLDI